MGTERTIKKLAFFILANSGNKVKTNDAFRLAHEATYIVDAEGISDRKRYQFAKGYLLKSTGIGKSKPDGRAN